MRARLAVVVLALLALPNLMAGCGSKFDLPTEHRLGRSISQDHSYKMLNTWHAFTDGLLPNSSLDGVQDVLLTQGTGTQLFVMVNRGGSGSASRGDVYDVALTQPKRLGHTFQTLFNPAAMCAGGDGGGGVANRIYVLDQGDTCLAKINPRTGVCDTTLVSDLRYYWRVREFGLLGGDTISTFTDLNFAYVNGIAADAQGSVYVAGVAIVITPSTDPRLFLRSFRSVVYKYRRGLKVPGGVPVDRSMPGAQWHRDTTYYHNEGNGVGYVRDPRGMAWADYGSPGLFVADLGNNSGQKVSDADSTGFVRFEQDDQGVLVSVPRDIAVDASGFVYVADTGNRRVLRFGSGGNYIQRVDIDPDDAHRPLSNPVGVAANDSLVYVADRGFNEIIRYLRLN